MSTERTTVQPDRPVLMHEGRPMTAARLARECWANKIVHSRVHPDYFQDMQDFSELDDILSRQTTFNVSKSMIRSKDGHQDIGSPAHAAEGLSHGLTLQIRNLEYYLTSSQPLLRFARALEAASGNPLESLSIFITPGQSQATSEHIDQTEIFTIQLTGTKRWKYYPIRYVENGDPHTYVTVTLEAGDFFYLPSGHAHFAVAEEEASISMALVYRPHKYELLWRYLMCDPGMRAFLERSIPSPTTVGAEAGLKTNLENFLDEFCHRLSRITGDGFAEFLLETARVSLPPPPILSLNALAEGVTEITRFERDKGKEADIYVNTDSLRIALKGGVNFTAPRFLEPEVRWILTRDLPFTAADVSARMAPTESMKLLKKLCHLGILKTVGRKLAERT